MPCSFKIFLVLFVIVLGTQTYWYRQSYKFLDGQLSVVAFYEIRNTNHENISGSSTSTFPHSLTVRKSTLSREPRNRKISQQQELIFPKLLQKSLSEESNTTDLDVRLLDEKYRAITKKACPRLLHWERSAIYTTILNNFTLRENDTRDTFVNLHRYGYLLDSAPCKNSTDLVILVHSKFDHFSMRQQIRESWASNRTFSGLSTRTIFFLGQPNVKEEVQARQLRLRAASKKGRQSIGDQVRETMTRIHLEAREFGDVVMGNFTDSYRNLTIKNIQTLDWVTTRCPKVPHVVKVDDDVMVNPYSLAKYIRKVGNRKRFLACRIPGVGCVQRKKRDKWFVDKEEYPYPLYPLWCFGYGILMSTDVAGILLRTSRDVRSFWIDDVYVTGILRLKAGIQLTSFPKKLSVMTDNPSVKFSPIFTLRKSLRNITFEDYWRGLQQAHQVEGSQLVSVLGRSQLTLYGSLTGH